VPVTVAFFVAAEELITLLFTADYSNAVPIFRWYSLLTLGRVAFYGAPILAAGQTRQILYASIFTLASNFALSASLALIIGFEGPAMGAALAFIPTVGFYCYYIAKSAGVGYFETFPLFGYLRVVLLASVAGALGWLVKDALTMTTIPKLVLVVFVVLASFGLLGSLLRVITRGDWRYALNWVRLRMLKD
jgi:O-antigen/teichoic acid export membrane protein